MSPVLMRTPVAPRRRLATPDAVVAGAALVGLFAVVLLGLRDFSFTDYEVEAKPAIDQLLRGDVAGYVEALPGYGGAVILQTPFAVVGDLIGTDRAVWAWRAQAVPGLILLGLLGYVLGRNVAARLGGFRGTAWGAATALLVAGAPFALLAQQRGHPEELLVAGMAVGAVLLAGRGNVVLAAGVVGVAAAAKPWAVIAIPVVLLAALDRRTLVRAFVVCVAAGGLLTAPSLVVGGAQKVSASTHSTTSGIFKPDNVFWFAGRPNPKWDAVRSSTSSQMFQRDATRASWAQRLEPAWAARVSHPAIVAFALLLAAAFWRLRSRRAGREDLLLLLFAVCWWRCLLDTWNVDYYSLGALLALAAWEASRGRPPVVAGVVTAAAWTTFQLLPSSTFPPDVHTALYLGWALPLGVAVVVRLLAPAAVSRPAGVAAAWLGTRLPTLARAVRSPVVAPRV